LSARQTEMTAQAPPVSEKVALPKPMGKQEADKPDDAQDLLIYSGRVLGPAGQPVAGAKLYMTVAWGYLHRPSPSPEYATSGPDGRFAFRVPKTEFGDQFTTVAAASAHYGVGWATIPADGKRDGLTVQMVSDDGPITGQIVDLEGKPVAGATLRLMQINAAAGDDLGPWLEAAKGKKELSYHLENQYFKRFTIAVPLQAATDAAGHFQLNGIGRNRLVHAQLDGPTIASQQLCILTRPGEAIQLNQSQGQPEYHVPPRVATYYGANFRLAAGPTKPIVGVVRDQDTKEPLPGITIQSSTQTIGAGISVEHDIVRTTTDSHGRYRLTGLPKGEGFSIVAFAGGDQPYGSAGNKVPDSPGLDPVTVDFELKRGIWIKGKITDKATGKPVKVAVEYFALESNANLRDFPVSPPPSLMDDRILGAKEYGAYRVLALPGPGVIAVWPPKDRYLRARERDDEYGTKEPFLNTIPNAISSSHYSAFARIDPAKGVDAVKRDVTLDPGWKFTGTVLGPDGNPLAGAGIIYLSPGFDSTPHQLFPFERLKTAEFTAWFNPRRPRDVLFQHREKGLIGVAHPPKGNGGSVTVRMQPGATVTGRLVDAGRKPRAGVALIVFTRPKNESSWSLFGEVVTTDGQGQFKLSTLLPGYEFYLSDNTGNGDLLLGDGFRLGETKNLGDVQIKADQ